MYVCRWGKGHAGIPAFRKLWLLTFATVTPTLCAFTCQDWTIIRPGGLKSDQATGRAILTQDALARGMVDRADVAEVIVRVLGSDKLCTRREFTVVDPTYSPGYAFKPFVL